MADINLLDCGVDAGAPLGIGNCIRDPKKIKYLGIGKPGKSYTAAQLLDARTTLQEDAVSDDPEDRIYIIPVMVEEDQSADVERFTYPDGSTTVTRDPIYRVRFRIAKGAQCILNLLLSKFSQKEWAVLAFDSGNTMHGKRVTNDNGSVTAIQFMPLSEVYVLPRVLATESDPSGYFFELQWQDYRDMNQEASYVDLSFSMSEIEQLQLGALSEGTWVSGAAGTVNIGATAGCGGQNLASVYGAALADTDNFVATNFATGAVITITAITVVTINGQAQLLFDFDSADSDYPTAGGKILVEGAAPSVIEGNIGAYIEIPSIILTRPA